MSSAHARLRIRRRISPAATLFRIARFLLTVGLFVAVGTSTYQYFTNYKNVGALEFTPHRVGSDDQQVGGAQGIDTGDLNGDGRIDIVVGGLKGVWVFVNNGDGTFTGKLIDNLRGRRVQVVDLDLDGLPDVLATLDQTPGTAWFHNDGGLEFTTNYIGTGKDSSAYAADLNGDHTPDIAVASNESGTYVIRAWINNGSGSFTSSTLPSTGNPSITALAIGNLASPKLSNPADIHYPDIVVSGSGGLQAFETSDGTNWTRYDLDNTNNNATHLAVGDVSNDGINDIVAGMGDSDTILLYKNIENKQFERATINPGADVHTIVIKDLDEDGDEDMIIASQDENTVYWYDNDGTNFFHQRTIATGITSVFGAAVADFDNDGDFDFATADFTKGDVWWYERTRAKPVATEPTNIKQTVDGAGRITFDTTISDGDYDPTRLRVQYSLDGDHWYKPWIIKATTDVGSVDLKNSNGYQIGTNNEIDTNDNDSVKLTLIWDTKSTGNTGGPIVGDIDNVRLRVIPRDDQSIGYAAISSTFRVDNSPPTGLGALRVTDVGPDNVSLAWSSPKDSSAFSFKLYYGKDHDKVLEQNSDLWDAKDDPNMNDIESTSTTVTGLADKSTYTFKLYAVDAFGNQVAVPSITATTGTSSSTVAAPEPTTEPGTVPVATPTPTTEPGTIPVATPTPTPGTTPTPTPLFPGTQATPPPTSFKNTPPVADAGVDQVINPLALVILDGTASIDVNGDDLSYSWRQLSGPEVELFSSRTATPSFSAGGEGETYIFALTVRDQSGASSTDTVTVAVKTLPTGLAQPVEVGQEGGQTQSVSQGAQLPPIVVAIIKPIDLTLFGIAVLLTIISLAERAVRSFGKQRSQGSGAVLSANTPKGKVVHYRTNEPIAGVVVLIYGGDGKLRMQERTNDKGEFPTLFPPGQYSLRVQSQEFTFAPAASLSVRPEQGILYSGGNITVPAGGQPVNIVIPMKPIGGELSSSRSRLLNTWQNVQRLGRLASWPVFIVGSLLNTVLIFWLPSGLFLVLEILYVFLVIIKVVLEVRIRPAYGLVRDSITHVPLDLAVVRLFEKGTNRLIMTRITDSQGKFFALPPAGTYTVTITKPGYAVFSKEDVSIASEQDAVLQMTADLMPVAPSGGLAQVQAGIL